MLRARTPMLFLVALGACDGVIPERTWRRVDLGGATLEARYEEPTGAAAFGPHTVRFYVVTGDGQRLLATTTLRNDGANPGDSNLEAVDRGDGSWLLTLKGQEQAEERWLLETTGAEVRMRKLD